MGDVDSFLEEQLASVKSGPGPSRLKKKNAAKPGDEGNGREKAAPSSGNGIGRSMEEEGDDGEDMGNEQEGEDSGDSSGGDSSSDGSNSDSDEDEGEGNKQEEEEGPGAGEEDEEEEEEEASSKMESKSHRDRERAVDKDGRKRSRSRERGERSSSKRRRRSSSADRGRDRSSRKDRHSSRGDRDDRDRRSSRRSRSREKERDSGRSSRRDHHMLEKSDGKDKKEKDDGKDTASPPKGKDETDEKKDRSRTRDKERSSRDKGRSRSRDRDRERRHRDGGSSRSDRDRDGRRDRDRDDRRDRDRRDRERRDRDRRDESRRSSRRSPSVSRSRSPLAPRRSEKTKEEREEASKRAAIDELTRDQRTVFVNQLTMKVTEDDLAKYFSLIGEVNNVIMLRDKFTNRHKDGNNGVMSRGKVLPRHKGFAYVEMKSLESVPVVLQLNERVPDFQKFPVMVKASEAEKNYLAKQEEKAKNPSGHHNVILGNAAALAGLKLHIGNLHQNITEDDLGEICRSFGEVTQLILHRDEAGESKRFAFVTFADKESTNACLEKLDGLEVAGKALAVSYCKADPKSKAAPSAATAPEGTSASWKLDHDDGASGMRMDSANRATIMAHLGGAVNGAAGVGVGVGGIPPTLPAAVMATSGGAMNMGMAGIPGMMGQGLPGIAVLPGMAAMGMVGAAAPSAGLPGVPSQSPSAAANAALEAALSGTAFGAIGNGMGGLPQMGGGQKAPGQVTGQAHLHPAIAAGLPGAGVPGGVMGPAGMVASVSPPPPAAPVAKPAVVGTPTFCLLVKNMFDPATETDENWELDIKEEMEEECSKNGTVMHSYVESRQPGGLVYVMFSTIGAASASAEVLNGRWFAGRMVLVEYLAPQVYTAKFPEATKAAQTALATAANA